MNKIGFIITRTSLGFSKLKSYNDGNWSSRVVDVRTYLGVFPDAVKDGNVLPFFSFDREGCLLGLLRGIPGRSGDNLCGWLYIPYNISVSGTQLAELVEFVKGVLAMATLTEVEHELDERFSREYPTYRAQLYTPSSGSKYAVRNPLNMEEILEHRYQVYYKNYGVVFLADPALLAPDYRPSVDDLTNKPVASLVTVLPPSNLDQDVSLVFAANGKLFTAPMRVDKNVPLQLIMRRNGFADVYPKIPARSLVDGQPITLSLDYQWKYIVNRNLFTVLDENRHHISNATITINNKSLLQSLEIPEAECEEAKVQITAQGYKLSKRLVNLFTELPFTETLEKGAVVVTPPVGGTGGNGIPSGNGGSGLWNVILLVGLSVLAGCLGFGGWCLLQSDPKPPIEIPEGGGGTETISKPDTMKDARIEKIKNLPNDVWDRQELSKVGLEELWDALNEYKIDELTDEGEWGKLLREAGRDQLVDAAKKAKELKVKHKPPYNRNKDDFKITLQKYIENLPQHPMDEYEAVGDSKNGRNAKNGSTKKKGGNIGKDRNTQEGQDALQ